MIRSFLCVGMLAWCWHVVFVFVVVCVFICSGVVCVVFLLVVARFAPVVVMCVFVVVFWGKWLLCCVC